MKTYKIKQGTHRARPLTLGLYWGRETFEANVIFDSTWMYQAEEGADINKLFGVAYLDPGHRSKRNNPTKKEWDMGTHKDSARFGWVPFSFILEGGESLNYIRICAYTYTNGILDYAPLAAIKVGQPRALTLKIFVADQSYNFTVLEAGKVISTYRKPFQHRKKIQFPLGAYFGGDDPAPKDFNLQIDK